MKASLADKIMKIVGKPSSSGALDLQLVQSVLFPVHLLKQVRVEMSVFNLLHRRDIFVPCYYGKMDGAALPTLYHLSPHNCKESSLRLEGMYGKVKHSLSSGWQESRECKAFNWFIWFRTLFCFCSTMCTEGSLETYKSQNTPTLV